MQAEGDVLVRRQVREEGVVLEEEADSAPAGRDEEAALRVEPGLVPVDDRPLVGAVEAGEGAQDGRLSGARRAEQDRHGAVVAGEDEIGVDRRPSPEPPYEPRFELCGHAATVRR